MTNDFPRPHVGAVVPLFLAYSIPSRLHPRISVSEKLNAAGSVRHGEVWFSSQVSQQEISPDPDDDGMQ